MTDATTPSATIVANTPRERDRERQAGRDDAAEHDRHDDQRDRQRDQLGALRVLLGSLRELAVDEQLAADEHLRRVDAAQDRFHGVDRAAFRRRHSGSASSSHSDRRSTSPSALGPCCTDATPGTPRARAIVASGHGRALDDRGDLATVRRRARRADATPAPTRTTSDRRGRRRVARTARPAAAKPSSMTATQVTMTRRGRRSAMEVSR